MTDSTGDARMSEAQDPVIEAEEAPAWLPERLERARRTAVQEFLADLGFSDAEALQQSLQQLEEGAQTITTLTEERAALAEQVAAAEAARRQASIEAAFIVEAAQYDFIDPGEVRRLADFSSVELSEDNSVTGMREAISRLVENRPHLLRRRAMVALDASTSGSRRPLRPDTPNELSAQQLDDLKRRFQLW
jgi:hypothetical protein